MKRHAVTLSMLAAGLLAGGCEAHEVTPPPTSLQQYNDAKSPSRRYPRRTIVLHNLQRVLDQQLPEQERVESVRLVSHLGQDDPEVRALLASLLADGAGSPALRGAVLEILLKQDYPDLAPHVVRILPTLEPQDPLKEQVLAWLARHPTPMVLAEVVKLWAKEQSTTSLEEPRYRQVVENLSGRKWEQALLEGINTPKFLARGSAMQVLAARVPQRRLAESIAGLSASSDAVAAMQLFLSRFGYLPTNGAAMLQCVWLYAQRQPQFDAAAELSANWARGYGYSFDVRDFHLLSRLAPDPLRRNYRRPQLIMRLTQSFMQRPYVARRVVQPVGLYDFSDRFIKHVESLTMPDLWNLVLLDEMLNRPQVQAALRMMVEGDRADPSCAWGGLVFYRNGQAEAKVYPPPADHALDDLAYVPSQEAIRDARDSLCRFHGHFEQEDNAARAGPTAEELQAARLGDYYGLVLTSVGKDSFCAHYYGPQGIVISMRRFPLR